MGSADAFWNRLCEAKLAAKRLRQFGVDRMLFRQHPTYAAFQQSLLGAVNVFQSDQEQVLQSPLLGGHEGRSRAPSAGSFNTGLEAVVPWSNPAASRARGEVSRSKDAALSRESEGGQNTEAGREGRISAGMDPRRCKMDLCWLIGVLGSSLAASAAS